MIYAARMSGRKVVRVERGKRSGHVRYHTGHEKPILESGWVRDPDISTGIPLLGLANARTSRNGPPTWPKIGTRLVVNALSEDATDRRWCRLDAYVAAYRRILAGNADGRSHSAHMWLFREVLQWIERGRPGEWDVRELINYVRLNGGNMVLVDRLMLYVQLDLDDDNFLKACERSAISLIRAPS